MPAFTDANGIERTIQFDPVNVLKINDDLTPLNELTEGTC